MSCQESLAVAMRNVVFIVMNHLTCRGECSKICSCRDYLQVPEQGQVRALAMHKLALPQAPSLRDRQPGFLVPLPFLWWCLLAVTLRPLVVPQQ